MKYDFACFIPGIPRPKGSKRYVGHRDGKPVLVEQSKRLPAWREALCDGLAIYGKVQGIREPMTGPVAFYFGFLFPYKKSEIWHTCTPDWSKLVRAVEDELKNAKIIKDDALLCLSDGGFKRRCTKEETPGVFVRLRALSHAELEEATLECYPPSSE